MSKPVRDIRVAHFGHFTGLAMLNRPPIDVSRETRRGSGSTTARRGEHRDQHHASPKSRRVVPWGPIPALGEEECRHELAALRALRVFDPDGDDVAKPLEH